MNIKYIIDIYGKYLGFYRYYDRIKKKYLFVYYIYDFYLVKFFNWVELFIFGGFIFIRNTEYDGIFFGFFVER